MKETFLILCCTLLCFIISFSACNSSFFDQQTVESPKVQTKKVTIYSTSWCGWCVKAKKFLDDYGVTYTEKDVENEEDRTELVKFAKKIGYNGEMDAVPLIIIDNHIIVGFNAKELMCRLGLKECTLQFFRRARSELRSE
tara:strand:- start:266 stop:685 length:420 start_codon:yes stop_codon:yes gene_type:complete